MRTPRHLDLLGTDMEKAMATHSSTLAWKIPWTEEPGRLKSMGSRRVGHDWATSVSLFTFMLWRRKWQPTPVFLPGESQGQGSLVGCCQRGCRVGHDWSDLAAAAAAAGGIDIKPTPFNRLKELKGQATNKPRSQGNNRLGKTIFKGKGIFKGSCAYHGIRYT